MKKLKLLILLPIIVLFTMANECDTSHELNGNVDVDVDVPTVEVEYAQINGINYIYATQFGLVISCMAIDPSTLYSPIRQGIGVQNSIRATDYSAEETANCSQ